MLKLLRNLLLALLLAAAPSWAFAAGEVVDYGFLADTTGEKTIDLTLAQQGDVLVIATSYPSGGTAGTGAPTSNFASWDELTDPQDRPTFGGAIYTAWMRHYDSTPPASETVNEIGTPSVSTRDVSVGYVLLRGVDPESVDFPAHVTTTGTQSSFPHASTTVGGSTTGVVILFEFESDNESATDEFDNLAGPSASWTIAYEQEAAGTAFNGYTMYLEGVAAGATGTLTTTFDSRSVPRLGFTVSFADAAAGSSAPTLSAATPSGTLETSTSATVGATTDQDSGTLYGVLSTMDNVSGASAAQIKSGQNSTSASADFADDAEVTDTSPEIEFTGLTADTTYYYALVQNNDNGDSNVVSGSFTTAEAAITATKLIFGSQPGNVVVGQVFGAFTVRAVDDENALDEDFESNVTITLQTGEGTLGGTATQAAVAGVATFDDIYINTLNTDAVIRATADGLTSADSSEFDVTAGGEGTAGFPATSQMGGMLQ